MSSLILSRRDLDFLLFEWLGVDELTKRERFAEHSRDTFEDILDLAELIATNDFAPHNKKNDSNEPTFDGTTVTTNPEVAAAVKKFSEAGFIGSTMDEEVGGMQLPSSVAFAAFAWFAAANVGSAGYPMLTMGNANLIISHGTEEQIDTFVRPMVEGRYFGTMCLSEPQAGSSLADVATRAEEVGDGTYRLFGNKMWISGGDHELTENIVHLVLARIPGSPAGVKGLSLFIVPKYLINEDGSRGERNDVALAGLNHKMGQRGITNTLLNFGEGIYSPGGQAGAVGYLVGEPNRGLAYMFHMMNEAWVRLRSDTPATCTHCSTQRSVRRGVLRLRRTRTARRFRSSSMPTCVGCCWRRRLTPRARWRSRFTAGVSLTSSTPERPKKIVETLSCCSTCSHRS